MGDNSFIKNANIAKDLADNGNFEKYGITTKEELDLFLENIPKEFIHIRKAVETAWIFKNSNNSKSLFEIRNSLKQEIKYLQIHDYLIDRNIKVDYTKLRETIEENELDNFYEVATQSIGKKLDRLKSNNENDYFYKINAQTKTKRIRESLEQQIKTIDNAINRNVYNTRIRNNTK